MQLAKLVRSGLVAVLLAALGILVNAGAEDATSGRAQASNGGAWLPSPARPPYLESGAGRAVAVLPSGQVLVLGAPGDPTASTLFDPSTGAISPTGHRSVNRAGDYSVSVLKDGRALVSGGLQGGGGPVVVLNSAELYDPASGSWVAGEHGARARCSLQRNAGERAGAGSGWIGGRRVAAHPATVGGVV